MISFLFAPVKNFSALATASSSLRPLDARTTQQTLVSSYSSRSRKTVPPQPISMSSLCAPRHNRRSGWLLSPAKVRFCMTGLGAVAGHHGVRAALGSAVRGLVEDRGVLPLQRRPVFFGFLREIGRQRFRPLLECQEL